MITFQDKLLTFADASKFLRTRLKIKTHPITLFRWATKGADGVRLETIRVGRKIFTSEESLLDFFHRRTNREGLNVLPAHKTRRQRQAQQKHVERELVKAGI
jgi:hypothetical protein